MALPLWAPRGQGVCRSTWFIRPQTARPRGCGRVVSVGVPQVLGWIGFSTWGCRVPRNSGHGVAVLSATPPALSPTVAAVCVGHCQEFSKLT